MNQSNSFSDNVARLQQKGAITYDEGSRLTVEDVYVVTLDNGVRPMPFPVRYKTKVDGVDVSGVIPANVAGMPGRKSTHPDYPCFRVRGISWRQPDPRSRVWYGTVRYDYDPSRTGEDEDNGVESITYGSVEIHTPITTGKDGASLRNSAGDPLDPVPMATILCPTVDIVRVESADPDDRMDYQGAINKSAVKIGGIRFPAHCARLTWTAQRLEDEEDGGAVGDRFRYSYHIEGNFSLKPREDDDEDQSGTYKPTYGGWVQYLPDAGWNYIDANGVKCRSKVSIGGDSSLLEDNPQQVFLDEDGAIKTTGYPRYIQAIAYPVVSFGPLNLP